MLSMMILGLLLGAARAADDDDPEPPAQGAGKLAGEWELSEMKIKGQAFPLPNELKMTFTFKKDGSVAMSGGGENKAGKYKVNAKKQHLDLTDGNMTTELIFKIEKDVLTLATSEGNGKGARPKDFATADATMIFKRKAKK